MMLCMCVCTSIGLQMNCSWYVCLYVTLHMLHTSWGTVERQLIPCSKLGLESCLGAKATQSTKVHYTNPSAQVVSFLHCVGGQNLSGCVCEYDPSSN